MGAKRGAIERRSPKKMILNSTTTCAAAASGSICTTIYAPDPSSTIAASGGFSYGEIVGTVLEFLILIVVMSIAFHLKFRKIKIKSFRNINPATLTTLTLLIAESNPKDKDQMVALVTQLLK